MQLLIEIGTALLVFSGAALCISLIIQIRKITDSVRKIQQDIHSVSQQLPPVIASVRELVSSVNSVAEETRQQLHEIRWISAEVRKKVEALIMLEAKITEFVEGPVASVWDRVKNFKTNVSEFFRSKFQK